jgi:quinolinate synthase
MNTATIKFDAFESLKNEDCQERIIQAKKSLGNQIVILGHHYQNEAVYRHADLTGDSLKLSKYVDTLQAKYIVFLGVHFMAEVADILSRPDQITVLPDLSAGCSMADMANLTKVERSYRELSKVLDFDKSITPITYINSAADLKAFCGDHGGVVCTSTNAPLF